MTGGRVIFLHGASSSGKTTLAQAIRQHSAAPWLHVSIDHLRESNATCPAHFTTRRTAFFDGFHRAVAGFAEAGNDLILEHILDTPGWQDQLGTMLMPYPLLFVGIDTPLAILRQREKTRGDRPTGSAEQDFAQIHTGVSYDLTLDGSGDPASNANRILAANWPDPGQSRLYR